MPSTLASDLTIVGAVTNSIVLELAGPMASGASFFRGGVLITLATTALGFAVLLASSRLGSRTKAVSIRPSGGAFAPSSARIRPADSRSPG
jgi:hypothetical protein